MGKPSGARILAYALDDVWAGVQDAFARLARQVQERYGTPLHTVGAMGVSGMMHGYLPFARDGAQLAAFRTWRNTTTERAAALLTERFAFNVPQRWSVAHLYQAILDGEPHVRDIAYLTTLAGYVHWRLTGERVLGVGEASGMFPIDSAACGYDAGMEKTVTINGKELTLGQTTEEVKGTFGAPTRIDETVYGLDRYIYTGDGYFWVTFENDAAVEFFTPSSKFQYQEIKGGGVLNDASHVDSISNVDHCAVLNGEYASARIPLDYENQICGLLLQTKEFAAKDALTGSLSGAQKTDIEKELLEIINVQRKEAGLAVLTENQGLDQTAADHSTEMVKEKYFDYKSKDGKTPFQRMMENNVQFHTASEVIATTRGDVVQLYTELLRTAAKHNGIMDSTMTQAGIGVANDGKVLYLTIDLCNG